MTGSATISYSSTPITVTVGTGGAGATTGGANSAKGGSSAFNDIVSDGGGRGGTSIAGNGGNGDSGGGALYTYTAGTGVSGFGFAGSVGRGNVSPYYGGSGGGALSAASDRIAGGSKQWLDGNYYAAGGEGYNAFNYGNPTNVSGSGGNGRYNENGTNGKDGIVIIRYSGIPRATGGTITYVGGFTYHTFTTSGDFTFNGVTTTTTSTTTTPPTTTTLASQKYYVESCDGPGSIVGVITITNTPTLTAGQIIRLDTNVAGLSCFQVYTTSTGTPTLGTRGVTNIYGDCVDCTD
jgi:hypothetical protein